MGLETPKSRSESQNSLRKDGGLSFATPPKTREKQVFPPTTTPDKAPPPTPEEAKATNAGEYAGETRAVEKVGGNKVLKAVLGSGAVAAGAAGAGDIAYEAVPAIHRLVDSSFLDHLRDKSISSSETQTTRNEVFDNTTKNTSLGEKNTHFISQEQAKEFNLGQVVINEEEQTIEHILPFKMPKGTTGTIERVYLKDQNPDFVDPKKLPPIEPIDSKFDDIVTIITPENAHVYLIRGNPEWGENPNFASQVRIYKYYKEANITVVWWFSDGGITTKRYPFNPLLPMQDFNKETLTGTNYEKLPVEDALTEVATTSEPNQPIRLDVMAYRGKVASPEAEIAGHDFLLKSKFKTDETGKATVIALED